MLFMREQALREGGERATEPEQIESAEMVAALSLQNDASLHSESGPIFGRATLSPSLVIRFGRL
jgi:hypothetical protein